MKLPYETQIINRKTYPATLSKTLMHIRKGKPEYLKPSYPDAKRYIGLDTETNKGNLAIIADSTGRYRIVEKDDTPEKALDFLAYKNYRGCRVVLYNIRFDVDAITKPLPIEVLVSLYKTGYAEYEKYVLRGIKKRRFGLEYPVKQVTNCFDMVPFYRSTLLKAVTDYLNPTDEEIRYLVEMKNARDKLFELYTIEQIIEYCIKDAKYTERLAYALSKRFIQSFNFNLPPPYSVAYLAQTVMKNTCADIPLISKIPFDVIEYAYRCYYGGWFEIFYRGVFKKLWKYDISSAYPATMLNLLDITKGAWKETYKLNEDATYGFYKAIITISKNMHIAPLPFRTRDEKTFHPVGEWVGYYTKEELETLHKSKDCKYVIIKGWEFYPKELVYPFRKYVDELYKLKSKETIDKTMRNLYKTILASSTGKFGQTVGEKMGMLFNSVYISIITAQCRLKMFEQHGSSMVSYATDCFISTTPLDIKTGNEIGDFKLEANGEKGIVIQNGVYKIENSEDINNPHIGERGFTSLFDELLYDVHKDVIKKTYNVPYTSGEALLAHDQNKINIYRTIERKCDINGDIKRAWIRDFKDIDDMLNHTIESFSLVINPKTEEEYYRALPYPILNKKDIIYMKRRYIPN